jgi:hypothetical protein
MPFQVKIPDSCADLCPAKVERTLKKHFGDIYAAARELGVPGPDLRRLTWAQPSLYKNALEEMELVVQRAMGEVIRALDSDDWRRRAWAADKIMSSWLARDHPLAPARGVNGTRGKRFATGGIDPHQIIFRRQGESGDETDKRDAAAAKAERLHDEGRLIDHKASPGSSNKD